MAAVLVDRQDRIFAWGWNNPGPHGLGTHAEEHALNRANMRRVAGSRIVVAGMRGKAFVYSRPCPARCWPLLSNLGLTAVEFTLPDGRWVTERI